VRAIGAAYRRALRHNRRMTLTGAPAPTPAVAGAAAPGPPPPRRRRRCRGGPRLAARLTSAPPRQPAPAPGRRRGARPPSRPRSSRETCPIRTGQTLAAAALASIFRDLERMTSMGPWHRAVAAGRA
jgi:hypothetical protein